MTGDSEPVFPPELWANIMRYCASDTLLVLALVSQSCHTEARRCLHRSLYFEHGSRHNLRRSGTRIRDLSALRRSLSVWPGWRTAVQNVRLRWTTNGTAYCWKEPERSETDDELQLNVLIKDTASVLTESAVLKDLHFSIPRLDSRVPFGVDRLTSLDIPITDCLHNPPDFWALLKLFQIPSLERVNLLQMLRMNCTIPESCRQPGTSSVKTLKFSQCGPVSSEIAHLLSWPKRLQVLGFEMDLADGLNRYAYDAGFIASTKIQEALWPVEHSLQDLNIDIFEHTGVWFGDPLQDNAFQPYAKLRRLSIPLNMFMEFSNDDPAPPLYTRLPPSIQELTLKLDRDFWWDDADTMQPSSETRELVAYVSDLAEHNFACLPNLKDVRISTEFHFNGKVSTNQLPLELKLAQGLVERLRSSGIALSFQ